MPAQNLSNALSNDILNYLRLPPEAPTLRYLNRLIHAYIRQVPWESVSRIIKRHATPETKNCPRLPEEFWNDAMKYGFGGTCFESSLAFYSLLTALGYEGYLTVNDMGDTRGCHAAIIITFGEEKYLVDATIPVHAAVRIDSQKAIRRKTKLFDYVIRPVAKDKYEVERSHRPSKNLFALIDVHVSLMEYQKILEDDYTESMGCFLKSVVMVKVVDDKTWRFFSDHQPYKLESFNRAGRSEIVVKPEMLPYRLARLFRMPEDQIYVALTLMHRPMIDSWVPREILQERSNIHA